MMKKIARKSPVVNGLRDISMSEFWSNPLLLAETLQAKLNGSPVDAKEFPRLFEEIQVVRELLFAFGSRRTGPFPCGRWWIFFKQIIFWS